MAWWNNARRTNPIPEHFGAVIDTSNDSLVAIGTNIYALSLVSESTLDTRCVGEIAPERARTPAAADPSLLPDWSWDGAKRDFKPTRQDIVTNDMRERSVLAAKKAAAFTEVLRQVNLMRGRMGTGFFYQNVIYTEKVREANALKEAGFDERKIPTLYVGAYAEEAAIPLRQAVEDILFQARLDSEYFAKTEKLRLAACRKLKRARTAAEVDDMLKAFRETGAA